MTQCLMILKNTVTAGMNYLSRFKWSLCDTSPHLCLSMGCTLDGNRTLLFSQPWRYLIRFFQTGLPMPEHLYNVHHVSSVHSMNIISPFPQVGTVDYTLIEPHFILNTHFGNRGKMDVLPDILPRGNFEILLYPFDMNLRCH